MITICVLSYNNDKFIKETIESILNQTYTDFELIICDDCSSDNSLDVIKLFKDDRIRVFINHENIGIVRNLNKCLSLSRGNIITLFSSDDVMMPDNLKRNVNFLKYNPNVGLTHSNSHKIDENGKIIDGHFGKNAHTDTVLSGPEYFKKLLLEHDFICAPSVFVRKECYDKLGGYDIRLPSAQDYEMWMRISAHYDAGHLSEHLILYRKHKGNYTYVNQASLNPVLQDYLARVLALQKCVKKKSEYVYLLREVQQRSSVICMNRAYAYYEEGLYYIAFKHLCLALKLNFPIIKNKKFLSIFLRIPAGGVGKKYFDALKSYIYKGNGCLIEK